MIISPDLPIADGFTEINRAGLESTLVVGAAKFANVISEESVARLETLESSDFKRHFLKRSLGAAQLAELAPELHSIADGLGVDIDDNRFEAGLVHVKPYRYIIGQVSHTDGASMKGLTFLLPLFDEEALFAADYSPFEVFGDTPFQSNRRPSFLSTYTRQDVMAIRQRVKRCNGAEFKRSAVEHFGLGVATRKILAIDFRSYDIDLAN